MPSSFPTPFQRRTLWNAAAGLAIVTLGAILVGIVWLGSTVFGYLQPVLVPLAFAGIIAYLLDPVVGFLMGKGLSRLRAVIVVFCGFVVALGLITLVVVPPIADQTSNLWEPESSFKVTPEQLATIRKYPVIKFALEADNEADAQAYDESEEPVPWPKTRLGHLINSNVGDISATGWNWLKGGTSKILGFFGYAIGFAMSPIYLFYFLKESTSIKAHWREYVPLKASRFKTEVVDTLAEINGYLISFFRGQVLVSLIDGVLVGITLTLFRLPYGIVIGLFLAILGIIPFVGNIICMIPACIIAFIHFSGSAPNQQWLGSNPWAYVGAVLAIFLIVQQINSLVTAPKIVGDSVGLHPMTVIFSMLFWSLILGGFLGALLAVPLTAAVKVLVRRFVWERSIKHGPTMADGTPEPT